MAGTLQRKTVLVVGRGSGISRAIVDEAVAEGARVIAAGRNRESLEAAYKETDVIVENVDVTDESSIVALAETVGAVDHVVSTASARAKGSLGELSFEAILMSFRTKVAGPIILAKHFAPRMPASGSFVMFSGVTALRPEPGFLAVGATNGAVDTVVRSLAMELAPIRVNAVSPGTVDSGAWDGLGEGKGVFFERMAAANPVRRIGVPGDVAQAVIFALTNTFMTGVSMAIDGGQPLV